MGAGMIDVKTLAACILNDCGSLSTMKLQKPVYYSQAYSLVRVGAPLFGQRIEAWATVERDGSQGCPPA